MIRDASAPPLACGWALLREKSKIFLLACAVLSTDLTLSYIGAIPLDRVLAVTAHHEIRLMVQRDRGN